MSQPMAASCLRRLITTGLAKVILIKKGTKQGKWHPEKARTSILQQRLLMGWDGVGWDREGEQNMTEVC